MRFVTALREAGVQEKMMKISQASEVLQLLGSARPSADPQTVRGRKITDQSMSGQKDKAYLTP